MPSLTITLTAEQAQRVSLAYGNKLYLANPATIAEVKGALVDELKSVVRAYETEQAHKAVVAPIDVEPT